MLLFHCFNCDQRNANVLEAERAQLFELENFSFVDFEERQLFE